MTMNILQAEDLVKGMPDQQLLQQAKAPNNPDIPQFLYLSEVQRRADMRKRFQAEQQQPQGTIADQILQGGIQSLGGGAPRGTMPGGRPPSHAPAIPSPSMAQPPAPSMRPPGMARGGIIRLAGGGMPQTAVIDGKTYTWNTTDYPGLTREQVLSLLVNNEYQGPREGASRRINERTADNYPWSTSFENWGVNAGIPGMGIDNPWPERDQAVFDTKKRIWEQYQAGGAEMAGPPAEFPATQGSNAPQANTQSAIDVGVGLESLIPDWYARAKGGTAITDDILSGLVERGYGKSIDEVRTRLDNAGITTYDEALALYNTKPPPPSSPGVGTRYSSGTSGQLFDAAEGFVTDILGEAKSKPPVQKDLPGPQVQGRKDSAKDAYSMLMDMYGQKSPDSPDMSDLVKQQQSDAFYGAMMQIAAGIGAGDMSKGIAAASETALEGRKSARELSQAERLLRHSTQLKDRDRDVSILGAAAQIDVQRSKIDEYITRQEAMLQREMAKQTELNRRAVERNATSLMNTFLRNLDPSLMEPGEYDQAVRKARIQAYSIALGIEPEGLSSPSMGAAPGERPGLETFERK